MRIISGKLKGRRLHTPFDYKIRPTTDKVKEAIFSMLTGSIDEESICIDLFCGTGNLGLEAISRGAKTVYFCDSSRDSIALAKENIKYCQVEDQAVVLSGDYKYGISRISQKSDIIFLDPPYAEQWIPDCISRILAKELLEPYGLIVAEHDWSDKLPEELFGLTKQKEKRYGGIGVTIYGFPEEDKK